MGLNATQRTGRTPLYEPDPAQSNLAGSGGGGSTGGGATGGGGASGNTGVDTSSTAEATDRIVRNSTSNRRTVGGSSGYGDGFGDYSSHQYDTTGPGYPGGGPSPGPDPGSNQAQNNTYVPSTGGGAVADPGNPNNRPDPTNQGAPGPGGGGAPPQGGAGATGGGGRTYDFQVDPAVAQKAWQAAGSPQTDDVNEWFKNTIIAGVNNPDGSPRWAPPDGTPWESGHSGYNEQTGQYGAFPSDVTGRRQWARDTNSPEDFDRFDEATLMMWENQIDEANCPPPGGHPNAIYQAYDGSGCAGKPIDGGHLGGGNAGSGGGGGGGGGGGRGGGGGNGGGGNKNESTVQERPDYDPSSNYVTQSQIAGPGYGPAPAADVGRGASPADPSAGRNTPAHVPPPGGRTPGGQRITKRLIQTANSTPGETTIPSSVIWTTGM